MPDELPDDADGDALRRIAKGGSDMSMPMLIDFQVAFPDEQSAKSFAPLASELGYHVRIYESPECTLPVTCECSTRMLATYDAVVAIQKELAALSKSFEGIPDGWGTFGNGRNSER